MVTTENRSHPNAEAQEELALSSSQNNANSVVGTTPHHQHIGQPLSINSTVHKVSTNTGSKSSRMKEKIKSFF